MINFQGFIYSGYFPSMREVESRNGAGRAGHYCMKESP
jgi:hypothetical protein